MAVFPQKAVSTQGLLDFVQRNVTLIVISGAIVTFWMLIYTFAIYKPSYSAKSVVIVKDSAITRRFVEPEQYYALQTTTSSSSNPILNTMGILKSSAISHSVYQYFQMHHPEQLQKNKIRTQEDWERFFGDGSAFIKAKNQSGTDLIAIQFSWSNPAIAKDALDAVVKAFQNASRDLNQEEQVSRTHYIERQVHEIEAQLQAIRQQKSEYQSRTRTVNVSRESTDLMESRTELTNRLNQIEAQAAGKKTQLARYENVLGMTSEQALKATALGQDLSLNKLQDELYRLQQLYAQQLTTLGEYSDESRETRAQMIQVSANIRAEKARALGQKQRQAVVKGAVADTAHNMVVANMVTTQGEIQDLQTQAREYRDRLDQIDNQISHFPEVAEEMANIEQKETSLSLALDQLRQKVLEGQLKEEQTLSNVFIVDAPRLPENAEFPSRNHLILLSLFLGLVTGVAMAFAKEQLFPEADSESCNEWLESLSDEEESFTQYANIAPWDDSTQSLRRNASIFNSLVPSSSPIEFQTSEASMGKQNPYMQAPFNKGKLASQGLHRSSEVLEAAPVQS